MLALRKINKGKEPITLTNYRSSIQKKDFENINIYDDFNHKSRQDCKDSKAGNLRKQLLEEQGYLCCYCMSRIACFNSKIEHLKDQSTNRKLQIDYQNLFIACKGNEGQPSKHQHCDSFKGAKNIDYLDLLSNIENDIKYQPSDGTISSDNTDIDMEINEVLNLNVRILKRNRKQAVKEFLMVLKKRLGTGKWGKNALKKEVDRYEKIGADYKFKQFSAMFVYFLNKKLQKL